MVKRDSWQNLAKSLKLIGEGGGGGGGGGGFLYTSNLYEPGREIGGETCLKIYFNLPSTIRHGRVDIYFLICGTQAKYICHYLFI